MKLMLALLVLAIFAVIYLAGLIESLCRRSFFSR